MGIHFYFCILTKNIQTNFKMTKKVLFPIFAVFLSMTNAAPSVQKNENENEVITKTVPSQKYKEELLYTVKCSGQCDKVKVEVNVNGEADMFVSKQSDVSWSKGRFNRDELLCESRLKDGYELCTLDVTENEFFVLIRAFEDHSEGTLTIHGSNLISAETQFESEAETMLEPEIEPQILTEYENESQILTEYEN